jgi:hypothetical protein
VGSDENTSARETHDRSIDIVGITGARERRVAVRELRTFAPNLMAADEPEPLPLP